MRLIDADELLKKIDTERERLVKVGMLGAEHIVTHYVRNFIEDAPTIDRPQGEWIDKGNWMGIECSRCKCHSRYVTPFCPQCGARMEVLERG